MTRPPENTGLSVGARLLRELGLSLAEIAASAECSKTAVHKWMNGKLPTAVHRRKLEAAFGIPYPSWDEVTAPASLGAPRAAALPPPEEPDEADAPADAEGPEGESVAEPGGSVGDEITRIEGLIQTLRAGRSEKTSETGLIKSVQAEGQLVERVGRLKKLQREEAALSEARIVRAHPHWHRTRSAIVEALRPHREAGIAVLEALRSLGMAP